MLKLPPNKELVRQEAEAVVVEIEVQEKDLVMVTENQKAILADLEENVLALLDQQVKVLLGQIKIQKEEKEYNFKKKAAFSGFFLLKLFCDFLCFS